MSINGSSYQTNSLNIGGSMYIDNVVTNQNTSLNSSISSTIQTGYQGASITYTYPTTPSSTFTYTLTGVNAYNYTLLTVSSGTPSNTDYTVVSSESSTDIYKLLILDTTQSLQVGSFYNLGSYVYDYNGSAGYLNRDQYHFISCSGLTPSSYDSALQTSVNNGVYGINFTYTFALSPLKWSSVSIFTTSTATYSNAPAWVFIFGAQNGILGTNPVVNVVSNWKLLTAQKYTFNGSENGVYTYNIPTYDATNMNMFNVCIASTASNSLEISGIRFNNATVSGNNYIGNSATNNVIVGTTNKPLNLNCSAPQINLNYLLPFGIIRVSPDETFTPVANYLQYNIVSPLTFTISQSKLPDFWICYPISTLVSQMFQSDGDITIDILKNANSIYSVKPILKSQSINTTNIHTSLGTLITSPTTINASDLLQIIVMNYQGNQARGLKAYIYWS